MSATPPARTLEGKVAIVTGASRGIGAQIAWDLASRGAKVMITYSSDRSRTPAETLVNRIESEANTKATHIQCDLKKIDTPKQIIDATLQAFGPHIDILINNAGIVSSSLVQDITPEHFDDVFHTNVRAPLLMVQAVLPHLRRPGRIINISSVASREGFMAAGVYSASKAALEGFTRNWAFELGEDGTTVNTVNPGPVQSEMLDQVDKVTVQRQKDVTPVGRRVGTVEEVAEIVAFLAEGRSSWVSGQCISASGGYAKY